MEIVIQTISVLSVATLVGSMLFFSAVVAPFTFISQSAEVAGSYIRGIFPWYYLSIIVLGLVAATTLTFRHTVDAALLGVISFGAIFARQYLMPRINTARDAHLSGDDAAETSFSRLHRLSVIINAVQLLLASVVLIRIAVLTP